MTHSHAVFLWWLWIMWTHSDNFHSCIWDEQITKNISSKTYDLPLLTLILGVSYWSSYCHDKKQMKWEQRRHRYVLAAAAAAATAATDRITTTAIDHPSIYLDPLTYARWAEKYSKLEIWGRDQREAARCRKSGNIRARSLNLSEIAPNF